MQPNFPYKTFLCLLSFLTSIVQPCLAQYEESDFVRYTVKDGLSDNYITCLQQDNLGYIWAGTNNGLNRFDGHSFNNFYQGSPALPLASIDIRNIKILGPQQLGIISGGGLEIIDTRDFSLKRFYIPDSTAFSTYQNAAWDAVELADHSYAMTTASGFYVFNPSGTIKFRHDGYILPDIGKKRILYGHEIFPLNKEEQVVYFEESGMAIYNAEQRSYRKPGTEEIKYAALAHPNISKGGQWITKYQLNNDEFFFIFLRKDSMIYYNHQLQKVVTSSVPFPTSSAFSWESRITKLSESSFMINDRTRGFYVFNLDRKTGQISFNKKKFLSSYKIVRLFVDKDKRLWAGTSGGLLQQKLHPAYINSYRFQPASGDTLTGGFSCTYRYKNKLYAGRFSLYKGLAIINASGMQQEKEITFYGGNNSWNEIRSIEMYHPDTLWIGTNAGILWFDTKTNHYGKVLNENKYPWATELSAILAPPRKDGYAWICSHLGGLVARYHIPSRTFTIYTSGTKPALPFDKVKSITYDSYGDVWIAGHSLTRWNNKKQLFDTTITVYGGANKFNDDILALSADDNGSLWLHNAFNGLLEYRIAEKKFLSYTMKDGLPSDVLQSFSPVTDHNLWIGSNNHLSRFDTRTKKIVIYDHHDGLPEHKPTGRKIWLDKEYNYLYLCADEYIVKFPLQSVSYPENSSGLILQGLVINNKKTLFQPGNEMNLKYNENNLLLDYSIINFEKNNYQFSYKLNNDEDWVNLGQQRSINLTNLQPGKYSIQLKATGTNGDEKIKEFSLFIHPPFWKSTWFLLTCGLLLTGILYFLYKNRIKQVRKKANIDNLLAQTEMKALHSQMNPHFVFNSLNSIREMILNNENKEASHYLSKFARLIRITLEQSGQSFISLRSTIDYLHRYLEMEKIRNNDFTYSLTTDTLLDMDETVLPPMLIQPFLENAIWHGVTANRKNINIRVNFRKENEQLVCNVEDDGIGINKSLSNKMSNESTHTSVGISNVQDHIRLLNEKYNLHCSILVKDKQDIAGPGVSGTLVTLRLPYKLQDE